MSNASRMIQRNNARQLYGQFSVKWRRERRLAGDSVKGYRKPSFSQWVSMHMGDRDMMAESTPVDVQEYMGHDPWESAPVSTQDVGGSDRGVITLPIIGDEQ